MKISYKWLKEYVDFDLTPQQVAEALTSTGLEVGGLDEVQAIPGGLKGLFVGKVLTCVAHPNSDHLHITTVDLGKEAPQQIVCGAPNVAEGQKVIVADLGCVLYDGDKSFTIKRSKLRGVASRALAYPCRMETGTLQHHVACGLIRTAALAAKDAGYAHRLLLVADGQIVLTEDVFLAVEGDKLLACVVGLDHNVVARDHVGVEAVHRLTVGHHDIVGDIDDIVDGTESDGGEFVAQPLRTLLHLAVLDAHAGVASAGLRVLDRHLDGQVAEGIITPVLL